MNVEAVLPAKGQAVRVAYSRSGGRLAVVDRAGWASVFDARDGRLVRRIDAGTPLNDVAFSPDGGRLAAGAREGGCACGASAPVRCC